MDESLVVEILWQDNALSSRDYQLEFEGLWNKPQLIEDRKIDHFKKKKINLGALPWNGIKDTLCKVKLIPEKTIDMNMPRPLVRFYLYGKAYYEKKMGLGEDSHHWELDLTYNPSIGLLINSAGNKSKLNMQGRIA